MLGVVVIVLAWRACWLPAADPCVRRRGAACAAAAGGRRHAGTPGRRVAGRDPAHVRRVRADSGAGAAEDHATSSSRGSCRGSRRCRTRRRAATVQSGCGSVQELRRLVNDAQPDDDGRSRSGSRRSTTSTRGGGRGPKGVRGHRPGARRPPAGEVPRVRREHGAPQARAGDARPPGNRRTAAAVDRRRSIVRRRVRADGSARLVERTARAARACHSATCVEHRLPSRRAGRALRVCLRSLAVLAAASGRRPRCTRRDADAPASRKWTRSSTQAEQARGSRRAGPRSPKTKLNAYLALRRGRADSRRRRRAVDRDPRTRRASRAARSSISTRCAAEAPARPARSDELPDGPRCR